MQPLVKTQFVKTQFPRQMPTGNNEAQVVEILRQWFKKGGLGIEQTYSSQELEFYKSELIGPVANMSANQADILAAFNMMNRMVKPDDDRQLKLIDRLKQCLIKTQVLPADWFEPPAELQPAPPPITPAQFAPQTPASVDSGLTASFDDNQIGTRGLLRLTRSSSSICCLYAPGIEIHSLLLCFLWLLLKDNKQVRPFEILRIYDPEGLPFFGLENTQAVVRGLSESDQPAEDWIGWIDCIYDAWSLVRRRRRARMSEGAMMAWEPALFVFPDWGYTANSWKSSLTKPERDMALNAWKQKRTLSEPEFKFPIESFNPTLFMRDVKNFGPGTGVKMLMTTKTTDCKSSIGLSNEDLQSMSVAAIGQHLPTGPMFEPVNRLMKIVDETEKERLTPLFNEGKLLSKQTGRSVMFVQAGEPCLFGAPDLAWSLRTTCIELVKRFAAAGG